MKVLIGCEYSGRVRDAFIAAGHDAMSCDLLPTDAPGPHYEGDIFDVINDGWDLAIFHPPCTYLANSGVRWLGTQPDRWKHMIDGAVFFRDLLHAPIPHIAVENPVMHGYARKIIGERATQTIHPWEHGHPEQKATGLWLRGLPPLMPTDNVREVMKSLTVAERNRIHYASPGPDRWKLRSTTYQGIADAMADQWGHDLAKERAA